MKYKDDERQARKILTARKQQREKRKKKKQWEDRKLREALALSPALAEMIEVRIDHRTSIYIKVGEDPEKKKKEWLEKRDAGQKIALQGAAKGKKESE